MQDEYVQLVDVRVEYLVHEPDTGRLERVLIWELDVDLPHTTSERCYTHSIPVSERATSGRNDQASMAYFP